MRWECRNIYLNIHTLLKITQNLKKCFKNEDLLYYRFNFSDFLTPFLVIAKFSYFFCFSHLITLHFITHHYLDIFLLQSRTSFSQWTSDCKQHAQFRTSIHSNFRRLGLDLFQVSFFSALLFKLDFYSATFGAFALGNVISWTSNSLQDTQIPADLGELGAAEAWVVSIFMIGAACVPWVASKKADKL